MCVCVCVCVCVCACVVCEGTSVDLKDAGLVGSVAKQCLLSASKHRSAGVQSRAVHGFTSADRHLRLPSC